MTVVANIDIIPIHICEFFRYFLIVCFSADCSYQILDERQLISFTRY